MRAQLFVVAGMLAVGFVACGGDNPPQSPVTPSFFGPPKSLKITGELSFTVLGQNRQLTASATFSNGAVRNVSSQAEWSSSNPAVATVSGGLVRVVSFGDAEITATYRNVSSAAVVVSAHPLPQLTSLVIAGPTELAPGTIAQYTATGSYSDGTTRDLSSTVSWSTFTGAQLRHVGGGRFEARGVGDGRVNANVTGRSASLAVIVVPAGTFRLSGTIRDASGGVENVLVEVISGIGAGLSTRSAFNGAYALFGVGGVVELRASAPGYVTQDVQVTINGHGIRDVDISTVSPTIDVSGQWTLTLTALSACTETWSPQARRREVTAVVTQQGTRLTIRFPNAAPFLYDTPGRIAGTTFSMTLFYDDYYLDYGLLERISPTEWVGVNGQLTGVASPSAITGQLAGNFNYYLTSANATFPAGVSRTCAADVPFELRR